MPKASGSRSSGTLGRMNMKMILFWLITILTCPGLAVAEPKRVSFTMVGVAWLFDAFPDGKVVGHYGSTAGDTVTLPPGTIDFYYILKNGRAKLTEGKGRATSQLLIVEDERPVYVFKYLSDDEFLKEALLRNWEKWEYGVNGEERLRPLLEKLKNEIQ